jgi:hypothetical protein
MISLKVGQIVRCPADRGDLPYEGKVTWIGDSVCYNHLGVPYVWVGVGRWLSSAKGGSTTWPSNRLGYKVTVPAKAPV